MAMRRDLDYMNREEAIEALKELYFQFRGNNFHSVLFLIQGTCLGAVRGGELIEGDTDVDFGINYEHFKYIVNQLAGGLISLGYEIRTVNRPFTRARVLNAIRGTVKFDFTSYVPFGEYRFCANTLRDKPYSIVYLRDRFKELDEVTLHGLSWKVPNNVEEYLASEYGEDWETPDSSPKASESKTRVYDFVKGYGVPNDHLESF